MASILYLFLTHLGAGVALTLLLVGRDAGVKFFRFNAGLAVALMGAGLFFRPPETTTPALLAFGVSLGSLTLYWLTVGRSWRVVRPVLLPLAVASAAVGVLVQALVPPAMAGVERALAAASFLSSAALLGGACTAMVLGHWYLVLPSLEIHHLRSMVRFHIGSLVVRIAIVAAAIVVAIANWQPGEPSFTRYILSVSGIFFWQRVLFGLAAPAVLAWLTWETAKIRSTQSATGILYVDFFTVVVGEVLAKYLWLVTKVPL